MACFSGKQRTNLLALRINQTFLGIVESTHMMELLIQSVSYNSLYQSQI